jgi:hypothetical protein
MTEKFEFHRVVADESRLFAMATSSAKVDIANKVSSFQRCCVTATPCPGGSVSDLSAQLGFLNSSGQYRHGNSLRGAFAAFCASGRKTSRPRRKPLSYLPWSCKSTHDSTREIAIHSSRGSTGSSILVHDDCRLGHVTEGTRMVLLLLPRIAVDDMDRLCFQAGKNLFTRASLFASHEQCSPREPLTKVTALMDHLEESRRVEPSFRVVVFTQSV